jgi:two-component system OmpR family sensor kinase
VTLKDYTLSIEDSGIGIEKEKLNKIYNRYFRATSSVGGFGIGLDIVSAICKTYNIKIEVTSTLHVGTKFTLHFT